jgi:lipoate-protein ligase A
MTSSALHIQTYPYDDDLMAAVRRDRMPRLHVYRLADTAVVLGRGSDPEKELHLQACAAGGVPLLRRYGGGCAVVVDPGNVIVTLVLPLAGLGGHVKHFKALTAWLIRGLNRAGIDGVRHEGISDLALAGRKIGGACIYRPKDLLCYGATLLVEPDLKKVSRYLRHPPREPAYRAGRSHRAFMASLAPSAWSGSAESLAFSLRKRLQARAALEMIDKASPGAGAVR